jgi:hypothetical protein
MKINPRFFLFSAVLGLLPTLVATAENAAVDCGVLTLSVKAAVTADQSKVLQIVATEVGAAPDCACEVVKAAIEGSKASVETVAAIVEAASIAAPEQMRLVSQCAVAAAPDALGAVQAVLAKLDPNLGESAPSAKDVKDSKGEVAAAEAPFNPLDVPGTNVPPTTGHPPGPMGPPLTPPVLPQPADNVTETDFVSPAFSQGA